MTTPPDNRRLTSRILAYEFIDLLSDMARIHGGDVIALLIFTGVWTANTRHLRTMTDRYAALHDIPLTARGGRSARKTSRPSCVCPGRYRTPMWNA